MARKESRKAHARKEKVAKEVGLIVFWLGCCSIGFAVLGIFVIAANSNDILSWEFLGRIAFTFIFITFGVILVGVWYWATHQGKPR